MIKIDSIRFRFGGRHFFGSKVKGIGWFRINSYSIPHNVSNSLRSSGFQAGYFRILSSDRIRFFGNGKGLELLTVPEAPLKEKPINEKGIFHFTNLTCLYNVYQPFPFRTMEF
ncbi:hypothetical protein DLM77_15985 [Leptospira yasudae]|uniref:Uncharacterized protein n=1 Tax=Leptospira yasudae TaxID=2202201 RepID=A0ABX9M1K3_9LEPT|nr:hypothetical protein DLM77_15985 [Leptospira yasudae]